MDNQQSQQQPGKILEALFAIAADVPAIGKDTENTQQHYNFRSVDAVMAALKPLLVKHQVLVYPVNILEEESGKGPKDNGFRVRQRIVYRFEHIDGSYRDAVVTGEGVDYGDKSCNKAMTSSLKYVLGQIFFIPYYNSDADPDRESPEQGPPDERGARTRSGGQSRPAAQQSQQQSGGSGKAKVDPEQAKAIKGLISILEAKGIKGKEAILKWLTEKTKRKDQLKSTTDLTVDEYNIAKKAAEAMPAPGTVGAE